MANYITKKHEIKLEDGTKQEKEIRYRIDADFKPAAISDICMEFIVNYCEDKNQINWLMEKVNTTIVDKNGKNRDYPFVSIRADFMNEFFPSIAKGDKKQKSWKDILNEKYK